MCFSQHFFVGTLRFNAFLYGYFEGILDSANKLKNITS